MIFRRSALVLAGAFVFLCGRDVRAQDREIRIRYSGEWHGLNRDLSLHHNTAQGRPTKLDVEDGPITDATGQPLVVEHQSLDGGWTRRYHIYIPGASNADRIIVIRYRVRN